MSVTSCLLGQSENLHGPAADLGAHTLLCAFRLACSPKGSAPMSVRQLIMPKSGYTILTPRQKPGNTANVDHLHPQTNFKSFQSKTPAHTSHTSDLVTWTTGSSSIHSRDICLSPLRRRYDAATIPCTFLIYTTASITTPQHGFQV